MWQHTQRLTQVWARMTFVLAAVVVIVMIVYGPDSGHFKLTAATAVLVNQLTIRFLAREWTWQARGCWWRFW